MGELLKEYGIDIHFVNGKDEKIEEKEKNITEDDVKIFLNQIQQVTDQHTSKIQKILEEKEKEIIEI